MKEILVEHLAVTRDENGALRISITGWSDPERGQPDVLELLLHEPEALEALEGIRANIPNQPFVVPSLNERDTAVAFLNVGVDVECGTCMETFFCGGSSGPHGPECRVWKKSEDPLLQILAPTQRLDQRDFGQSVSLMHDAVRVDYSPYVFNPNQPKFFGMEDSHSAAYFGPTAFDPGLQIGPVTIPSYPLAHPVDDIVVDGILLESYDE